MWHHFLEPLMSAPFIEEAVQEEYKAKYDARVALLLECNSVFLNGREFRH